MYSPKPIENAPATSEATPVRITAWVDTPPPPTPAISDALVTSPSTAPNTVGRSGPPASSRSGGAQPVAAATAPVAWDGSGSWGPWGSAGFAGLAGDGSW